jgi:hypothetical protein
MTCPTCNKRQIARGRDLCQSCDRKLVNGPKHEPACERCRDSGRIEMFGPYRRWKPCECSIGAQVWAEMRAKQVEQFRRLVGGGDA